MTISDWIVVVAVLLAPILAVQIQKWLERARERRTRKLQLFQTLMSTRTARVAVAHVQALNMIDVEFAGVRLWRGRSPSKTERQVLDAWRVYHDLLNDESSFKDEAGAHRREDAFVELLYAMSRDLGYDFDKVYLRKGAYSPVAHAELETDQRLFRKYMMEILEGRRATSVLTFDPAELARGAQAIREREESTPGAPPTDGAEATP